MLQDSLAKTLAQKARITVAKVLHTYGKPITVTQPNGRAIHFFNEPLKQVKKAKITTAEVDALPTWGPRRTQTRLGDPCAICGSPYQVEMHHVRPIRKRGQALRGFALSLAAINRTQLPVCHACHRDIHRGRDDGASLKAIVQRLQMRNTEV